ncbi:hypothetical protein C6P40_002551 [Pichia californica]|uniref:Vacuolar protein-sorting-associated protein 25 n=1 Tax=Pichia californica TaxID=460514 RepID=A0A9P6WHK2_9ASCO|nr:hypothetical protein C6P42_002005 [[Candida] californica]KAG0687300.1 hypothetical protein C6P40_002551 [[Candida] californica]
MNDIKKTGKFEFPKVYNFPPFFTEQPNSNTFQSQLEQWKDVIIKYCKFNKLFALSITGKPLESEKDELDNYEDNDEEIDDDDDDDNDNEVGNNDFSIFKNDNINRTVSNQFIRKIYEFLIESEAGEWIDLKNKNHGILIYWYGIEEWSQILYDWIDNTGQLNSILTIYEIRKGNLSINQEFYNMNNHMLIKILNNLVNQGKATIMKDENNNIVGVKFGGV